MVIGGMGEREWARSWMLCLGSIRVESGEGVGFLRLLDRGYGVGIVIVVVVVEVDGGIDGLVILVIVVIQRVK
jgi:hypothetical protein